MAIFQFKRTELEIIFQEGKVHSKTIYLKGELLPDHYNQSVLRTDWKLGYFDRWIQFEHEQEETGRRIRKTIQYLEFLQPTKIKKLTFPHTLLRPY